MKSRILIIAMLFAGIISAQAQSPKMTADQAKEEQAYTIGVQTAIWGLPLYDYVNGLI